MLGYCFLHPDDDFGVVFTEQTRILVSSKTPTLETNLPKVLGPNLISEQLHADPTMLTPPFYLHLGPNPINAKLNLIHSLHQTPVPNLSPLPASHRNLLTFGSRYLTKGFLFVHHLLLLVCFSSFLREGERPQGATPDPYLTNVSRVDLPP